MQAGGGLGYDDLNELMKSPEDLEFILELLTVEHEYEKASPIADPYPPASIIEPLLAGP